MNSATEAPQFAPPAEIEAGPPTEAAEKIAAVEIDINDLSLADEELVLDPNADAFGFAAPPSEKGNPYRAKLSKTGPWNKAKTKRGVEYFTVGMTATLQSDDKKLDGRKIQDMPAPSTLVLDSTNTCRIQGIVQELSGERIERIGRVELARRLDGLLAGEPIVGVILQWEAFCNCTQKADGTGGVRVKGEQRFPEQFVDGKPTGQRVPRIACKQCGNDLDARARIVRYKRL